MGCVLLLSTYLLFQLSCQYDLAYLVLGCNVDAYTWRSV